MALALVNREAAPGQWGFLQGELGRCLSLSSDGDRAENLDLAITHFSKALEVYTDTTHPDQWTMLQDWLGLAYLSRPRGDGTDNLERAIEHLLMSIEVRPPK